MNFNSIFLKVITKIFLPVLAINVKINRDSLCFSCVLNIRNSAFSIYNSLIF